MVKRGKPSSAQPDFDPVREFIKDVPRLVTLARYAALNHAYSWRDFNVGVSAHGHIPESGQIATVSAGNLKPRESEDKICAEKIALRMLKATGMVQATGLVIVATTDRQKIAEVNQGLETPTLPPCLECRSGVCVHNPLMRPETLIVTAGLEDTPAGNIYQVNTNGELLQYYDDENYEPLFERVRRLDTLPDRVPRYDHLVTKEYTGKLKKPRSRAILARIGLNTDLELHT